MTEESFMICDGLMYIYIRCALMVWSLRCSSSEVVAQQHAPTVETPRQVLGLGPVRGGDVEVEDLQRCFYMSKLRGSKNPNGGLHQA